MPVIKDLILSPRKMNKEWERKKSQWKRERKRVRKRKREREKEKEIHG